MIEPKQVEPLPENPTDQEIRMASKRQLSEYGKRNNESFATVVSEINRRKARSEQEMDTSEDDDFDDFDARIREYKCNIKCLSALLSKFNLGKKNKLFQLPSL